MWRHKFHWGSTLNRYTVIRLKKILLTLYVLTLSLATNVCNFVRFACSSAVQSSIHFGLTPTQNYWKRFQWNPRIQPECLLVKNAIAKWRINVLEYFNSKPLTSIELVVKMFNVTLATLTFALIFTWHTSMKYGCKQSGCIGFSTTRYIWRVLVDIFRTFLCVKCLGGIRVKSVYEQEHLWKGCWTTFSTNVSAV